MLRLIIRQSPDRGFKSRPHNQLSGLPTMARVYVIQNSEGRLVDEGTLPKTDIVRTKRSGD